MAGSRRGRAPFCTSSRTGSEWLIGLKRHREIEEPPPRRIARATDLQRCDHRAAGGNILAHGLVQRGGDALDGAWWLQAEIACQRLIGDEGVVRAAPSKGFAGACGKGGVGYPPTPSLSATSSNPGSAA